MGAWAYAGDDPGMQLYTLAMGAWHPKISTDARVLEVGCCETTFLEHMRDLGPHMQLVGVDWRARRSEVAVTVKGDVRDPGLFDEESFDAVVGLSVIEHVGLGHYDHDPVDPEGDVIAMRNIARWLKPGGWVYLDVPFTPNRYRVDGTRCREYDLPALTYRLVPGGLQVARQGFVAPRACSTWIEQPTEPMVDAKYPYYYAAMLLEKAT